MRIPEYHFSLSRETFLEWHDRWMTYQIACVQVRVGLPQTRLVLVSPQGKDVKELSKIARVAASSRYVKRRYYSVLCGSSTHVGWSLIELYLRQPLCWGNRRMCVQPLSKLCTMSKVYMMVWMWEKRLSALGQITDALGWLIFFVLDLLWVLGSMYVSTRHMFAKDSVCWWTVRKKTNSQYCERRALPVVRVAHAVGELLFRWHSRGTSHVMAFPGPAAVLIRIWNACQ